MYGKERMYKSFTFRVSNELYDSAMALVSGDAPKYRSVSDLLTQALYREVKRQEGDGAVTETDILMCLDHPDVKKKLDALMDEKIAAAVKERRIRG